MNSRDDVMTRLLNIFRRNVISTYFDEKASKKHTIISQVVANNDDVEIAEFVRDSFDMTRQHVFLLTHNITNLDDLPTKVLLEQLTNTRVNDTVEYFGLHDVVGPGQCELYIFSETGQIGPTVRGRFQGFVLAA